MMANEPPPIPVRRRLIEVWELEYPDSISYSVQIPGTPPLTSMREVGRSGEREVVGRLVTDALRSWRCKGI